jgi:hypothetical protein
MHDSLMKTPALHAVADRGVLFSARARRNPIRTRDSQRRDDANEPYGKMH